MASPSNEICIITAGRPGHGKSTVLNNIFDLELEQKISPRGVTKGLIKHNIVKGGAEVLVVDTPGLGDLDIPQKEVTENMATLLNGRDYTLVYCINVGPGNRFTEKDINTMRLLQLALGKRVWLKSVLLFTFSDCAKCEEFDDDNEGYKEYLEEFTLCFNEALTSLKIEGLNVKSILACEGQTVCVDGNNQAYTFNRIEKEKELIAIPIGETKIVKEDILPCIIPQEKDWTYLAFIEFLRVTEKEKRRSFLMLKFGQMLGSAFNEMFQAFGDSCSSDDSSDESSDEFSTLLGDLFKHIHTSSCREETFREMIKENKEAV